MRLETLNATHATYDADTWDRYASLYKGGRAFRERIKDFLPKNPAEPAATYNLRLTEAAYRSYVGPIVDFFAAQLFSAPLEVQAKGEDCCETDEPPPLDPYYAGLKEDCDGSGGDLIDFLRTRFTAALVEGSAWWLAELPDDEGRPPQNRMEWTERGLGDARLVPVENEQVLDWEQDRSGALTWAIVHSVEMPREAPTATRGTVRETWRIYDRTDVETFAIEYDPKVRKLRNDDTIPSIGKRAHGFTRVPLVRMGFVGARAVKLNGRTISPNAIEGLWLLNRVADGQLQHFRLSAAYSHSLLKSCFSMPVFKLVRDDKGVVRPPTMGTGYYLMIGTDEDVEWIGPETSHLAALAAAITSYKDEIYRVSSQMAAGVDNNAAAIGRSGESKAADAASTEVCLRVYGAIAKAAVEDTFQLLADGRRDDIVWHVSGLDTFNVADATTSVENATLAEGLSIPSTTFRKELLTRTAAALLPQSTAATRDAIRREIHEGVEAEAKLHQAAEDLDEADDEDEDADGEGDDTEEAPPGAPGMAPPAPSGPPPNAGRRGAPAA